MRLPQLTAEQIVRANGVDLCVQALADAIPGARLLALEHTGHELPPAVWDAVALAIQQHTTQ